MKTKKMCEKPTVVRDAINRISRRLRSNRERCIFLGTGGGREALVLQKDCHCAQCDIYIIYSALRKHNALPKRPVKK